MGDNGINLASSLNRERMPRIFSLEDNPFHTLKATYRSTVTDISHLVEDAEMDGIFPEDELQKARQALVTPRTRLKHELTWLPELSQLQAAKLFELLRKPDPATVLSLIDPFPELASANVAAHLCSAGHSSVEVVRSLARSWDEIDEARTLTSLNEGRRLSGFPKVEALPVSDTLRDIRQRHAAAAAKWIWTLAVPGSAMNIFVEQELKRNPEGQFLRHLVEIYDKESEPQLATIQDSIGSAIAAAREVPNFVSAQVRNISKMLEGWDAINQPVQVYFQFRGQEEGRSKKIYEMVRELCLELANVHDRYDEALQLSTALLRTFPELESVAESLKNDISALEDLARQKRVSDHLKPLVEACENAKKNAPTFGKTLRSSGFTERSGKIIGEVVKCFETARRNLPEPGVAYLVVRDLALSLNNDNNDAQSAFLLVDGLIKLDNAKVHKDVLDKLSEERSILHKNWKMKEFDRQSGNLNGMLKVVDEMLVYANATDRKDLQKLKSKLEGKKFAKKVKFVIYAGIAGVIGFVVLADEFNKPASRSTYQPPTSNQTAITPAPVVSDPYKEDVPPVGSGLSFTRDQVRYCIFQGTRLDFIRPLTTSNTQIDNFNALIEDYNSRCANFRYASGVLESVQSEVSNRSASLREDARRMVAWW